TPAGSSTTGTHFVAFQTFPPSFAHAVHFSPGRQSCANRSHSKATPPPSGPMRKTTPVVSMSSAPAVVPVSSATTVVAPLAPVVPESVDPLDAIPESPEPCVLVTGEDPPEQPIAKSSMQDDPSTE